MAISVLSRPKVHESHSREPFDRSFVENVNQSAGMIRPVFCEPVVKGTKGVINRRVFTRASQVVSPAFPDVKQCFDFFKVPLRLLITSWLDYDLNINDIHSSALVPWSDSGANLNLPNSLPCFNFGLNGNIPFAVALHAQMTTLLSWTNDAALQYLRDSQRVFEGLGYGQFNQAINTPDLRNLLPLAAYQAVYYHHYRNTIYESNNPYAYNLDWLFIAGQSNQLGIDNVVNVRHMLDLCKLRYINYRNDYWHNIYPSLNLSRSTPDGSSWTLPSSVVGASVNSINAQGQPRLSAVNSNNQLTPSVMGGIYSDSSTTNARAGISVQQIRAAFALDKLMRATAYTPKHVRDQVLARYGVEIGRDKMHEVDRIGSFENTINFGEVTNTAESSYAQLGAVGGKGIGADDFNKDIEFYADEDCIILGVCYFIPRAIYDHTADPWTMYLVREDFPQPEFQNLGLRPLVRPDNPHYILGYTVPDVRYKIGIDNNQGLFKNTTLALSVSENTLQLVPQTGVLSNYTLHTNNIPTLTSSGVTSDWFKVFPEHLDPIFVDSYSGEELTDQFFYNVRFKFAVTAPLSVHGQPSL